MLSILPRSRLALLLLWVPSSMGVKNVVSLKVVREIRKAEQGDPTYEAKILTLDKLELLEEMMRFQEERSHVGHLTLQMMIQGQILFKALEERAETQELQSLARSYKRHLKYELEAYFKEEPLAQWS